MNAEEEARELVPAEFHDHGKGAEHCQACELVTRIAARISVRQHEARAAMEIQLERQVGAANAAIAATFNEILEDAASLVEVMGERGHEPPAIATALREYKRSL